MPLKRIRRKPNAIYVRLNIISVVMKVFAIALATMRKERSQLQILKKSPKSCQMKSDCMGANSGVKSSRMMKKRNRYISANPAMSAGTIMA